METVDLGSPISAATAASPFRLYENKGKYRCIRPQTPSRPGTAHGERSLFDEEKPVRSVFDPGSRFRHDFSKCVSRAKRERVMGAGILTSGLDYTTSTGGLSSSRNVSGFRMADMTSRDQRQKTTNNSTQGISNDGKFMAGANMSWKAKGVVMMDKGTSREKRARSQAREAKKFDLPWYDGMIPEKHVMGVNIQTQISRNQRNDDQHNRTIGQDQYYTVPSSKFGKKLHRTILLGKTTSRSAPCSSRYSKLNTRKVEVALSVSTAQCGSGANNGKHTHNVDFMRTTDRDHKNKCDHSFIKRHPRNQDCSLMGLKVRHTMLEKRLKTPVCFEKQTSRPAFYKIMHAHGRIPYYDVNINPTRPRASTGIYNFYKSSGINK